MQEKTTRELLLSLSADLLASNQEHMMQLAKEKELNELINQQSQKISQFVSEYRRLKMQNEHINEKIADKKQKLSQRLRILTQKLERRQENMKQLAPYQPNFDSQLNLDPALIIFICQPMGLRQIKMPIDYLNFQKQRQNLILEEQRKEINAMEVKLKIRDMITKESMNLRKFDKPPAAAPPTMPKPPTFK